VDAAGVPLAVTLTGGNRNDITQLLPLVGGITPVAGKVGRPRQRPDRIVADRGYDYDTYRRKLWRRGVKPSIARRGTEHGSGLGRWRWVLERAFVWLDNYRRLRIRWEHDPAVHMVFLTLERARLSAGDTLARLMHNDASKKSSFTENFGSAAQCLRSPSRYFNSGYFNSAPMELAPKLK
jgi:transposase